ncbi:T9SS type A sorting domain-containing protein [Aestuariivivens sediminicola]|uniref:T9SS type A sorting domain-containing protein n=1 Tax=Aestuariivivens sediminicola TaxID=2913560 RepID=UPI001F5A361A|nr:T9SS type A sorting domain-containing protein [Aestuariivivens sediminicola]
MKPCLALFLGLFTSLTVLPQDILISGFGHGYGGRNAGFVELYIVNDINSDQYTIKAIRPNTTVLGQTMLFPPLSGGTYYYLAIDELYFQPFFGFAPNDPYSYVAYLNGDETVTIEDMNGTLIDIYGEIGVDGFGTAWEYSRGWAYRKPGFGPNTTFTLSEWIIMDDAFIDGCSPNSDCTDPYPSGSYTLSNDRRDIPEFSLYPNPTKTGYVNIVHRESTLPRVKLYTVSGQLVLDEMVEHHSLDVSQLAPGIYFLRMNQDQSVLSKRLIVH